MSPSESDRSELQRLYREAVAAIEAGNFLLAIELLAQCLAIDPRNAYVLNDIGRALDGIQQFGEAIPFYRRAIDVNPELAVAHFNLGRASLRAGDFAQAEASFSRTLELDPRSTGALKGIGEMFRAKRDLPAAAEAYLRAVSLNPESPDALECAVTMSILRYLDGDHAGAREMVQKAAPIAGLDGRQYLGSQRYATYLSRLSALAPVPRSQIFPAIHVVGDSHTISAHGVDIEMEGANHTCASDWIERGNLWSICGESPNQYQRSFDLCLRAIPKHDPVLLLIGQLDCLAEGGIFRQWQKNPASAIEPFAAKVVGKYLSTISAYRREGWERLIIGGVPAPGGDYPVADGEVYLGMVRSFNTLLRQSVRDAGLPFLDLYAMTATPDGKSNGLWHVDFIHLRPDAFVEAFRRHLLHAEAVHPKRLAALGGSLPKMKNVPRRRAKPGK